MPNIITTSVIEDNKVLVKNFSLYQNYPNPFNPSTTIKFAIPKESFIRLEIFNSIGEKVTTLISETLLPGIHLYNWKANDFASGVYFYCLSSENLVQTKKTFIDKIKSRLLIQSLSSIFYNRSTVLLRFPFVVKPTSHIKMG